MSKSNSIILLFLISFLASNALGSSDATLLLDHSFEKTTGRITFLPTGKNCEIIGAPNWIRTGLEFDGKTVSGLLLDFAQDSRDAFTNDFTLWTRVQLGPEQKYRDANHDTLFSWWGRHGHYSFLLRSDHYTGTLILFLSRDGKNIQIYDSGYRVDRSGVFHDLGVVVEQGKQVSFFVDGQLWSEQIHPPMPLQIHQPHSVMLGIGYNSDPARGRMHEVMNGTIASVKIHTRALSGSEIAQLSGLEKATARGEARTIDIDVGQAIGRVSPFVFGHFLEHFQDVVYGGVCDRKPKLEDTNILQMDVVRALRDLKPAIVRWPGGNFTSAYNWRFGAGPRDERPVIAKDPVWKQRESNAFGTPEFINLCRELDAEPYICVGVGRDNKNPTPDEAAAWVRYCNDKFGPEAELRRSAGYPEPFDVTIWGLGNEVYGHWQVGHYKNAKDYAEDIVKYAAAMRKADPHLKFVICGDSYKWNNNAWNSAVLTDDVVKMADWISYHSYTHLGSFGKRVKHEIAMQRLLGVEHDIEEIATLTRIVSRRAGRSTPIKIAVDEWNEFSWGNRFDNPIFKHYNLSHALFTASFLNILVRHSDSVTMANYSPSVNCRGAIHMSHEGVLLRATYPVFKAFSQAGGGSAVSVKTEAPIIHGSAAPSLDVSAVLMNDNELLLFVVNRDPSLAIPSTIRLKGFTVLSCTAQIISGDSIHAYNDYRHPNRVDMVEIGLPIKGEQFTHGFSAHSVTVFRLNGSVLSRRQH